jgi:hypothetical protein
VADIPDHIVLKRHRDLAGRGWHTWVERGVLVVLTALVVAALLNQFGQRPTTVHAAGRAASLELYAPDRLRGGLIYETRLRIHAHEEVKKAVLVLSGGWLEGFTMNTMVPSPLGESSRDGKLVFTVGHIPANRTYTLYMLFQVNPTNVGDDRQDITLLDGDRRLAELHRTVTTFP